MEKLCHVRGHSRNKGSEKMYTYSLIQWLMFFYTYCFFGWCFESTYVSLKSRQLVNRGFLNGPFLPIYGFGAISVLFVALPFKESPIGVYFIGAMAATALEYVTGVIMEAVFKVRYWDYSNQKFNFQGHICLSSTIAWGFLSLAMVFGFHNPVEKLILSIPAEKLQITVLVVSVVVAADCAVSFKDAFELRDLLVKTQKLKDELRMIQRRLEVVEAVLGEEGKQRLEQVGQRIEEHKEQVGQKLEERREQKERRKEERKEERRQQLEALRLEMTELKEKQLIYKDRIKTNANMQKIRHVLKRHPSAISKKYGEIFEELRERIKNH